MALFEGEQAPAQETPPPPGGAQGHPHMRMHAHMHNPLLPCLLILDDCPIQLIMHLQGEIHSGADGQAIGQIRV